SALSVTVAAVLAATTARAQGPAPSLGASPRAAEDPASGPIPVEISLADAVKRALEHNPTVTVAGAEIARADALIQQARAGWYPILTGNGALTRLDEDRVSNGAIVAPEA